MDSNEMMETIILLTAHNNNELSITIYQFCKTIEKNIVEDIKNCIEKEVESGSENSISIA